MLPSATRPGQHHVTPQLLSALLLLVLAPVCTSENRMAAPRDTPELREARELFSKHWHHHLHSLSALQLNEQRMGDLLGPVLRYKYDLPPVQVQKSLVYLGPNHRLRRVVHDLMVGKTIRVGAVGGSITHGAAASKIGETDWFSLVGKYLQGAFPKSNVIMRNGALPATPSALMNMCLETYVDEEVDVVFVEYAANDGSNR